MDAKNPADDIKRDLAEAEANLAKIDKTKDFQTWHTVNARATMLHMRHAAYERANQQE